MPHLSGVKRKNETLIIGLPDTISMDNCFLIEKEVESIMDDNVKQIAFDVGKMDTLYSCAMGMMIRFHRKVIGRGGAVSLVNVSAKLRSVLETVNLNRVFSLYATDVEFELAEGAMDAETVALTGSDGFMCFSQLENGVVHITLTGPMNATQDLTACNPELYNPAVSKYVIDFTGVEIIDSVGSGSLNVLIDNIRNHGGKCVGFGASEEVSDLITVLGIQSDLPMYATEAEAVKALG